MTAARRLERVVGVVVKGVCVCWVLGFVLAYCAAIA